MAKFCTNCGKKIQDDIKYCPYCGAPVLPPVSAKEEPEVEEPAVEEIVEEVAAETPVTEEIIEEAPAVEEVAAEAPVIEDAVEETVAAEPVIEEIAEEKKDVLTVAKVDVDEETELAIRFGVSSIPTVVLIKDGAEADRFVGYRAKEDIEEFIG